MSELARFLGIVIAIYYREHGVPHLHVSYSGDAAIIAIKNGTVLKGNLPGPALKLAREWIVKHREWLLEKWKAAQAGKNVGRAKKVVTKGRRAR